MNEEVKKNKRTKLQILMIQKGVLVYQLAKGTGVTSVQVSRIINRKSDGSVEWWKKASEFLEVEMSEIIE